MLNRVVTQLTNLPVQRGSSSITDESIFDNVLTKIPIGAHLTAPAQWETAPLFQPAFEVMPQQSSSARNVLFKMAMSSRSRSISAMYSIASQRNGNYVIIDQKYGSLPLLWGKDERPVAVYEIVEEIETVLDFRELHTRFPTLSYTQLSSALGFLRSLAQFNSAGVDIDALQNEEIEDNQFFQDAMRQAVDDEEVVRVLAPL